MPRTLVASFFEHGVQNV